MSFLLNNGKNPEKAQNPDPTPCINIDFELKKGFSNFNTTASHNKILFDVKLNLFYLSNGFFRIFQD